MTPRLTVRVALFSIALTSISTLLTGALWTASETQRLVSVARQRHENLIKEKRAFVQGRVDDVIDLLRAELETAEADLRTTLVRRVENAARVAQHLQAEYTGILPEPEIKRLVIEALRPLRYDGGRGYIFAVGYDGTELLYPPHPEMEGENLLYLRDKFGNYVIREEIAVARREGGGFTEGWWENPQTGKTEPKTSYVFGVPRFSMLIGSGDYVSAQRSDLAVALRDMVGNLPLDHDEYLFGGTYEGVSLVGPRVGQNMWNATDSDGLPVVQELVRIARSGGGFLRYRLPEETGLDPIEKLSYVQGLPELGWYLGVGFNIESAAAMASEQQRAIKDLIASRILIILSALVLLLTTTAVVTVLFARRIQSNFTALIVFSEEAARSSSLIDIDSLPFREFRELADATNSMVDGLRASVEEKAILLREIHHRVKNNLQVVASILNLQSSAKPSDVETVFRQAQNRIGSMAMVHEMLYGTESLSGILLCDYVRNLTQSILSGMTGGHEWVWDIACADVDISVDAAVPIGLILTELVSNAVRHGGSRHPGTTPTVNVTVETNAQDLTVTVYDNGDGIPPEMLAKAEGLGLKLVRSLVSQLDATLEQLPGPGSALRLTVARASVSASRERPQRPRHGRES